jgi:hypothetical protein
MARYHDYPVLPQTQAEALRGSVFEMHCPSCRHSSSVSKMPRIISFEASR